MRWRLTARRAERDGQPPRAVVPGWLAETARMRPAPPPWPSMARAALAVCGPLAVGLAVSEPVPGLLAAMGGLLAAIVDQGGPYPARIRRIAVAGAGGGAAGLLLVGLTHGLSWAAVLTLVAIAGVSALLSVAGSTASVTGLQLLVYAILGSGPLGAIRPWWEPPLWLLAGVAWAVALQLPGWLLHPLAPEQRSVAAVYSSIAAMLTAIGTAGFGEARLAVTAALNTAHDDLLARRARSEGRDAGQERLAQLLAQTHPLAEAATALAHAGTRLPAAVPAALDEVAGAILRGGQPPAVPAFAATSAGEVALREALQGAAGVLAGGRSPARGELRGRPRRHPGRLHPGRLRATVDRFAGGRLTILFAVRLMLSIGVAAVASESLPVPRSYWVMLTVALVLRPDLGSVFARGVQRGIGTVAGAVAGAVILLLVPYGPLLLVPCAVLAALLPYGRIRNYGLFTSFMTPLVVVLIDLLTHAGWQLATDRLIDTLLGCAIALGVGYAPWPASWHAHLPGQLATALDSVAGYTRQALAGAPPGRSRLRRRTYRALSDLRTDFQRTLAEPPAVSRLAATWWPALVGLEHVMDNVTASVVGVTMSAVRPAPGEVAQVADALAALAGAIRAGTPPPALPLPDGAGIREVGESVREVQRALAPGARPQRA